MKNPRSLFRVIAAFSAMATAFVFGAGCRSSAAPKVYPPAAAVVPGTLSDYRKPAPAAKPTSAPVIPAAAAKVPRPN